MKKALHKALVVLTTFSLLGLLAPVAGATGVFDTFQNAFQSASQGWFGKAQGYANDIFYTLLLVDFVWLALTWVLSRKTMDEMLPSFIRKVMVYGFFLALLINAGTWLPAIVNGFQQMGTGLGGVPTMTPSTLVDTGDALAYGIVTGDYGAVQKYVPGVTVPPAPANTSSGSSGVQCNWYTLCLNKAAAAVSDTIGSGLAKLEFFIIALIFAGLTWIAFLLIAIDLLITLIEAYVVLGAGVIFLGFGASRWTTKFADGILNYAVSVGVKLMVLYLVIGTLLNAVVPTVVSQLMVNASSGTGALNSLLVGGAGVLLMLMLSKSIPSKAQSLLSGVAALSGAHALQEVRNTSTAAGFAGQSVGAPLGFVGGRALAGAAGAVGLAKSAFGGSITPGGQSDSSSAAAPAPSGGGSASSAAGSAASKAGAAAGKGVEAAGKAAGQGMQAAGSAIAAIPIPVVAQAAGAAVSAAGTAVSAAGTAAGKGVEAAGKAAGQAVETTGKVVEKGVTAAKTTADAGYKATTSAAGYAPEPSAAGSPQATESGSVAPPTSGNKLKPAPQQNNSQHQSSSSNPLASAARAAGMLTQHNGGAVGASHISTGHGND